MKSKLIALLFTAGAIMHGGTLSYSISMDTSPLVGNPAGPFYLEFQFTDGSGTNDANNTVLVDTFNFGSGSAAGSATLTGGASGSLTAGVTLTDSDFFNQLYQGFLPGNLLKFRVTLSNNVDGGGVPDEFSFAILDSSLFEIPTLGPADAFLIADIDSSNPALQSYASDGGRTTISINAPSVDTAAPEPSAAWLAAPTLGILFLARRRYGKLAR